MSQEPTICQNIIYFRIPFHLKAQSIFWCNSCITKKVICFLTDYLIMYFYKEVYHETTRRNYKQICKLQCSCLKWRSECSEDQKKKNETDIEKQWESSYIFNITEPISHENSTWKTILCQVHISWVFLTRITSLTFCKIFQIILFNLF